MANIEKANRIYANSCSDFVVRLSEPSAEIHSLGKHLIKMYGTHATLLSAIEDDEIPKESIIAIAFSADTDLAERLLKTLQECDKHLVIPSVNCDTPTLYRQFGSIAITDTDISTIRTLIRAGAWRSTDDFLKTVNDIVSSVSFTSYEALVTQLRHQRDIKLCEKNMESDRLYRFIMM